MPYIRQIFAREILDSRGNPTLEVKVETISGTFACASIPSGASKGKHEALELRDNDLLRFNGKGVLKSVDIINNIISKALKGVDVTKQNLIDKKLIDLDNTENKTNLGANTILCVSLACAKTACKFLKIPLYRYLGGFNTSLMPIPMMNILNGGAHASFCIDFQEIMIIPINAKSLHESVRIGAEIFSELKMILKEKGYATSVGDEGGYAPNLKSNSEAFELVLKAIKKAKYKPKIDVCLAIDVASTEFYDEKKKTYSLKKDNIEYTAEELVEFYERLIDKYPIISIEDGLAQDDWDGWIYMSKRLGNRIQLVGDDLFVTNLKRLKKGIDLKVANAILVKLNQIGTLSETFEVIEMAKKARYGVIISHRSGETNETFIADLAIAVNAGQIKTGSLSRMERVAKYNRLMYIEDEINEFNSTYFLTYYNKEKSYYNLKKHNKS